MKITKPHENIIKIYLDSVSEKPKALKYLLEQGCVKTQYVEPLFMAAPEYLGQLLAKDKLTRRSVVNITYNVIISNPFITITGKYFLNTLIYMLLFLEAFVSISFILAK